MVLKKDVMEGEVQRQLILYCMVLQDSFRLLVRHSSARTYTQGLTLGHEGVGGDLLEGWDCLCVGTS